MIRTILAPLVVTVVVTSSVVADDAKDKTAPKPTQVTITHVDTKKGEITVKFTDEKGKEQQKTFQLTKDVHIFDETGRVATIDVFESGRDALVLESEGKLKELRHVGRAARQQRLSDAVRTLIEMAEADPGYTEEVQRIYDMLRKLDPTKSGKIDANELKAEANRILEERVNGIIERLDANKDGKISKEEAKGLIKDHFDRLDTNKDGFVDQAELLKAAKAKREAKAAESKTAAPRSTNKERN